MIAVMLGALGLLLGSFANVLVWRTHKGTDWLRGRSECVHCHHPLAPQDLIPVLSWLWLRGHCRYCHKPIKDSPPWVELLTGALFAGSYLWWPLPLSGEGLFRFVLWLVMLICLVALVSYDLRWFLLPDGIVAALTVLAVVQVAGVALGFHGGWQTVWGALGGVLVLSGTFYLLFQLSKGKWIGAGDVKLGVALGLLAGTPIRACLLLFTASVAGSLIAVPLLFAGKAHRKTPLPFGPLLILGLVIVQLFGTTIVNWYTTTLTLR